MHAVGANVQYTSLADTIDKILYLNVFFAE